MAACKEARFKKDWVNSSHIAMDQDEVQLLAMVKQGDRQALGVLFDRHRNRLKRMVETRIDPRVRARIDASDVIQDVQIEATRRLTEYLEQPNVSFFTWMRFLAKQKMAEIIRRNVHAQARDVRRELNFEVSPEASSIALAGLLLANVSTPSALVAKAELKQIVDQAIGMLEPMDQEILLLRHVELLDTHEAAQELQISPSTCRQRHFRALRRLREILTPFQLEFGSGL